MTNPGSKLAEVPIYDITRQIHGLHTRPSGCGGQSDVYPAYWASPDKYLSVAVKVLRFAGDPNERIRKRLDSEISLWGRVSHRNLQRLLGVCYVPTSALPAMVSEWHPNGDITSYLKTRAHDPELQEMKYRLLIEVLDGVEYLHMHDIVHGDIKGANVLISNDGSARLSDFGFSIILSEHSRSRSQRSAANGTTRWMAPEFFEEDDRVAVHTKASDVWALGCLIIEVQTGSLPYSTKRSDHTVLIAISKRELPALQPFKPDALWQLMLNCCQGEPSSRYVASRVLSDLRIERFRSHLHNGLHDLCARPECLLLSTILTHRDAPFDSFVLDVSRRGGLHCCICCQEAHLDVRDQLRSCIMSHSPLEPLVAGVLSMIASDRHLNPCLTVIAESVRDLLATCVDIAQHPPTDTSIKFLVNTVDPLLRLVKRWDHYFRIGSTYSAEVLRPLAKILSEHGHAPLAPIIMRFCATAPGSFPLRTARTGDIWSRPSSLEALTTWSVDGTLFAIADGASVAISEPGRSPFITLTTGQSSVGRIAMSPDGQLLACSCISGRREILLLWDIRSQSTLDIGIMPADLRGTRNLTFSQDGGYFASIHATNTAYVWRVGRNPIHLAMPRNGELTTVAFTATSIIVAGGSSGRYSVGAMVSVHDFDTNVLVTVPEFFGDGDRHSFGGQGRYLIDWRPFSTTLRLYDPLSGQMVCLKTDEGQRIQCVALSLDGSHAAAGTGDGFVSVWDVETGMLLENSPLRIHRDPIARLTFSSDGTKIVTLTWSGEACISDIRGSWLRWDL